MIWGPYEWLTPEAKDAGDHAVELAAGTLDAHDFPVDSMRVVQVALARALINHYGTEVRAP